MTLESFTSHTTVGSFLLETQVILNSRFAMWNAHHIKSNQEVSIKIYSKQFLAMGHNQEYYENDIYCFKNFFHPFIAKFIQVFEDDKFIYIILEPMKGGSFKELLGAKTRWNESQSRNIFIQLFMIIEYIQAAMNMVHGNICLDILMVDENNHLRLIDFWGIQPIANCSAQQTEIYSPIPFDPPEHINRGIIYPSADLWDLGVFLYYIVVGSSPFPDDEKASVTNMLVQYPSFLSQSLIDLLKKLISLSPAHRINFRSIKEHPWFAKTQYNLLTPFLIQNDAFSAEVFATISNYATEEKLIEDLNNGVESPEVIMYNIAKAIDHANQVYNAVARLNLTASERSRMSLDSDHSLMKSHSLSSFGQASPSSSNDRFKIKPVALQLSRPVQVASRRGSKVIPTLPRL